MSQRNNEEDELLASGPWGRNVRYYQLLNDEALKLRHTEATNFWFRLVMSEQRSAQNETSDLLTTIAFWRHIIDVTESLLKERGLDF